MLLSATDILIGEEPQENWTCNFFDSGTAS